VSVDGILQTSSREVIILSRSQVLDNHLFFIHLKIEKWSMEQIIPQITPLFACVGYLYLKVNVLLVFG